MTTKRRKATPRATELAIRRAKALQLRSRKFTFDQIAEELDYCDKAAAWRDIQEGLKEIIAEPAEAVRTMELDLLDAMARGLMTRALRGDDKAIASMLRIQERRAKFMGLDMPTQIETSGDGTVLVNFTQALNATGMAEPDIIIEPTL